MPGKLLEYITNFPRVVGGIDEESTRRAVELYRTIVRKEITATSVLAAELAKTMENAYRDVNIAFSNEMARICETMGVDVYEIRRVDECPPRPEHAPAGRRGGWALPAERLVAAQVWRRYLWQVQGARTYDRPGPRDQRRDAAASGRS